MIEQTIGRCVEPNNVNFLMVSKTKSTYIYETSNRDQQRRSKERDRIHTRKCTRDKCNLPRLCKHDTVCLSKDGENQSNANSDVALFNYYLWKFAREFLDLPFLFHSQKNVLTINGGGREGGRGRSIKPNLRIWIWANQHQRTTNIDRWISSNSSSKQITTVKATEEIY